MAPLTACAQDLDQADQSHDYIGGGGIPSRSVALFFCFFVFVKTLTWRRIFGFGSFNFGKMTQKLKNMVFSFQSVGSSRIWFKLVHPLGRYLRLYTSEKTSTI